MAVVGERGRAGASEVQRINFESVYANEKKQAKP